MTRRLVSFRDVDAVADVFADAGLDVREVPKGSYDAETLVDRAADAAALFVHSENEYGRDRFEAVASLRVIGKAGSGIDNVDVGAATDNGVAVVHTPGMNAESVGEYAVGLLIAYWRRIPAAERHLREGGWRSPSWWGTEIRGKTVGLVGLGAAGRATAERLRPFGPDLLAHDPYVDPERAAAVGADLVSLDELLDRSDVVSLHVRLTDETRGMIDADAFARMDDEAVLVNTARGAVVDRAALLDALDDGTIGGAALDVLHEEPPDPSDSLFAHENVLATPHLAGAGRKTRIGMLRTTAEAVVAVLDGEPRGTRREPRRALRVRNVLVGGRSLRVHEAARIVPPRPRARGRGRPRRRGRREPDRPRRRRRPRRAHRRPHRHRRIRRRLRDGRRRPRSLRRPGADRRERDRHGERERLRGRGPDRGHRRGAGRRLRRPRRPDADRNGPGVARDRHRRRDGRRARPGGPHRPRGADPTRSDRRRRQRRELRGDARGRARRARRRPNPSAPRPGRDPDAAPAVVPGVPALRAGEQPGARGVARLRPRRVLGGRRRRGGAGSAVEPRSRTGDGPGRTVLVVGLVVSLVGLQVGLVVLLALPAVGWIGAVYGRFAVGAWLLSYADRETPWEGLVAGVVLVGLLGRTPYVGPVVRSAVLLFGLGALVVELRSRLDEGRPR